EAGRQRDVPRQLDLVLEERGVDLLVEVAAAGARHERAARRRLGAALRADLAVLLPRLAAERDREPVEGPVREPELLGDPPLVVRRAVGLRQNDLLDEEARLVEVRV